VRFEWDPRKAASNKRRHGVSFEEAMTCFADPLALVLDEKRHPGRLILIGASQQRRVLFTVFAELVDDHVRIISARRATRRERRRYEEGID
jgi:uncharacterized DUF497 family protein